MSEQKQSSSRAGLYLLGIVSIAIIFVFVIIPHNDSFLDVEKIHKKHHGDAADSDRKIDKESLHVEDLGGNNEVEEATIVTKKKKVQVQLAVADVTNAHDDEETTRKSSKFHHTSKFREDLA